MGGKDYHDYFIKNGVHVGRYEDMYKEVDDPWHIDRLGRRLDMDAALLIITLASRELGRPFGRILDLGCGKGFFTNLIHEQWPQAQVWASDISQTAVDEAQKRYPGIEFFAFDAMKADELDFEPGFFDLIVIAQTLWCVLEGIDHVLGSLQIILAEAGALVISQNFLQPGAQSYGNEVMETPDDLYAILKRNGYRIKDTLETNRATNHHLAVRAVKESGEAG